MKFVLDIETLPMAIQDWERLSPSEPPSKLQTKEEIAEWREEQYRRTALDGTYGRIFCVCLLELDDKNQPGKANLIYGDNEMALLGSFWQIMGEHQRPYFVTHNGLSFDLPFIWKRSVIHCVKPTIRFNLAKYRTDSVFDTMAVWANWERQGIKLDALAQVLGVPGKTNSGAEVFQMWEEGKHDDIAEYCLRDTYVTYLCYCRMNFLPTFSKSDFQITKKHFPA